MLAPYGVTHHDTPNVARDMPGYGIKEQCHSCIDNVSYKVGCISDARA